MNTHNKTVTADRQLVHLALASTSWWSSDYCHSCLIQSFYRQGSTTAGRYSPEYPFFSLGLAPTTVEMTQAVVHNKTKHKSLKYQAMGQPLWYQQFDYWYQCCSMIRCLYQIPLLVPHRLAESYKVTSTNQLVSCC